MLDPVTGRQLEKYPLPPLGQQPLGNAVDGAGDIFVNMAQDDQLVPVGTSSTRPAR